MACPLQWIKAVISVAGMINERKEEAMKLMTAILMAIMVNAKSVLASGGQETMGTSLLVILFLGFGAFIVVCQLIPATVLFCSMLKGLFDSSAKGSIPKTGVKTL
jgi:hypothetical protein